MRFARRASNESVNGIVASRSIVRSGGYVRPALWLAGLLWCGSLYALQGCITGTACLETAQ